MFQLIPSAASPHTTRPSRAACWLIALSFSMLRFPFAMAAEDSALSADLLPTSALAPPSAHLAREAGLVTNLEGFAHKPHTRQVWFLFAPKDKALIAAAEAPGGGHVDGGGLIGWDLNTGGVRYSGGGYSWIGSASSQPVLTKNEKGFMIVCWDGARKLRGLATKNGAEIVASDIGEGRYSIGYSQKFDLFYLCAMRSGNLSILDSKATVKHRHQFGKPIGIAAFDHNDEYLLFFSGEKVFRWAFQAEEPLEAYSGHEAGEPTLLISSRERPLMLSATHRPRAPFDVRIWDTDTFETKGATEFGEVPHSIAIREDWRFVATGEDDGRVLVADTLTQKIVHEIPVGTHSVTALSFSPCGTLLVVRTSKPAVSLWKLPDFTE